MYSSLFFATVPQYFTIFNFFFVETEWFLFKECHKAVSNDFISRNEFYEFKFFYIERNRSNSERIRLGGYNRCWKISYFKFFSVCSAVWNTMLFNLDNLQSQIIISQKYSTNLMLKSKENIEIWSIERSSSFPLIMLDHMSFNGYHKNLRS